jgi:4-amino-4-deoxy-L-arabinose transferase-like glycosyltransferase
MRGGRKQSAAASPVPAPKEQPSRTWVWLLLILAIATFLRFYQLDSIPPALSSDEAHNGNDILEAMETGHFRVFYPQNSGREGLFINFQALFVALLGNKAWVLRLPSAILGVLTVLGLYYLAKELFTVPIGLAASFLLATSTWHLNFSRIGLRAISAPFFLVWSVYLLIVGLRRKSIPMMALAGIVYGLGFHTYTAYRITPVLIAVILAYHFRTAFKEILIFVGAAAVAVAPLAIYALTHKEEVFHRSAEVSIFNGPKSVPAYLLENIWKMIAMIFWRGDIDWLHGVALQPAVFLPVAILFGCGVALALGKRRFSEVAVLTMLVMGLIPALLSKDNMPNAIRSILMLPAICILAAITLEACAKQMPARWAAAMAGLLAVAFPVQAANTYFGKWAHAPEVTQTFNTSGYNIAQQINASTTASPKYVVVVAPGQTGLPPSAQTVMFLTRSYTQKQRELTNIHYIARERADQPEGVALCRQFASTITSGDLFCLQLIAVKPPAF